MPPPRKWYLDAFAAFAFFIVAVMLGRVAMRALGPVAGLLVLILNGGLGWLYARAAWNGLMGNRVKR